MKRNLIVLAGAVIAVVLVYVVSLFAIYNINSWMFVDGTWRPERRWGDPGRSSLVDEIYRPAFVLVFKLYGPRLSDQAPPAT